MGFHANDGKYHAFRKSIIFSLNDFREVDANGDVGNIVANGGLLASDSTPILRGNAAETHEISWAASNSDIIMAQTHLDDDFSGKDDVLIELDVNSGTTDPATFTAETGWDGGTLVSTTVTDGAKSATTHTISALIPHGSIPDSARYLTLMLTPGAHTTNAIQLLDVRMSYVRNTQS